MPLAILNVGGMDDDVQQKAEPVDNDVALAPNDLLARIKPLRVTLASGRCSTPKKGPEKKEGCCVNQMRHPSSRSANWLGAQRDKIRVIGSSLFDCAGDTPARFDLDFSIGDRARYMTARTDQQPFTDGEVSFEPAPHIGVFGRGLTIEDTGFSDDYVLAFLQCCLNRALDDQTVAGRDLAGQRHALSEDQGTSINLVTP